MTETTERDTATDTTPEGGSRWEDLIDIYIAPADLFRRRANDRVRPPLLMLLGASFVLYLVLLPANRLIISASVPDDPQAAAFMEQYGTIMQLFGAIFVPITTLAMVAFGAALIWLFGKVVGVNMSMNRAMLIGTYAGFVLLLGQVAAAVLVLVQAGGPIDIARDMSLGPLRFTDVDAQSAAVPLLRRFEIFAIWQAALWGAGVRYVLGTTAGKAAAVALLAWAAYGLPPFLFALVTGGGPAAG